jgi:ribonuclease I
MFKENQILPLDEMIKFAKLKFMHCYANQKLPLSFHGIWPQNRDVNPARILRNANDLRIPPHHFATIKRLPIFNFPQVWNEEEERKSIPSLKLYCKTLKTALLNSLAA